MHNKRTTCKYVSLDNSYMYVDNISVRTYVRIYYTGQAVLTYSIVLHRWNDRAKRNKCRLDSPRSTDTVRLSTYGVQPSVYPRVFVDERWTRKNKGKQKKKEKAKNRRNSRRQCSSRRKTSPLFYEIQSRKIDIGENSRNEFLPNEMISNGDSKQESAFKGRIFPLFARIYAVKTMRFGIFIDRCSYR